MPDSRVDELINEKEPFDFTQDRDSLFLEAMREAFRHHYNNCLFYRRLCRLEGFSPESFLDFEDIFYIPHFFVNSLKYYSPVSVPLDQVEITLKSSGTGGQRSQIFLDDITLRRISRIVFNIYEAYSMANRSVEANYILFSYEYEHARDVGTAFSDKLLSGLTGVKNLVYALKWREDKNDFSLDTEGVIDALIRFDRDGAPLRIIGFPAFLYELCLEYRRRNLPPLHFDVRSFIIIGGGWKTRANEEIPKEQFKKMMEDWLGLPAENVRDLLGLVEHGVPYVECEKGNMHVPIYSRAAAREPDSLRVLPDNSPGLLHFYTPYLHSFPAISLLTSDIGSTGINCPCGRNAPYIKMLGRAGIVKHKGCAIRALDFLPMK